MSASVHWHASIPEQRIAWAVAICCMVIVALVAIKPEWFTGGASGKHSDLRQANAPHSIYATTHRRQASLKVQKKARATIRKKTHTVAPPARNTAKSKSKPRQAVVLAPTAAPAASGYYAQLGAFHERSRAQGMADQLKHHGWHAVIATTQGGLNAVWVGPKSTRSGAETLLKSIQRKIKNKGFIVHHP